MKTLETIIWDSHLHTWHFPLDEDQLLPLTKHYEPVDGYVAIVAVAPFDYDAPDLILPLPVSIPDLRAYFNDGSDQPFIIRFGRMPAEVLANLREHDGW